MAEIGVGTHGTYHLADNPTKYDIQRTNNFEFVVTGIDSLFRVGANKTDENAIITGGQEVIRLSVVKASVPTFTQEVIKIPRGNTVIKAAGVPTFSDGTLEVNDYIGADTKSVLLAWQRLSYDVGTEKVGAMAEYKKDCVLIEYTPDYKQVRYWDMKGCWISGISEGAFDMESNSKQVVSVTIVYDRAIPHLPDDE